MLANCTAGYKQVKAGLYVSSSSPLPLATCNKHTNMIKESRLHFLLTLNLINVTSISVFKQSNDTLFFEKKKKKNSKSKYINIPKGLPYPSTNSA